MNCPECQRLWNENEQLRAANAELIETLNWIMPKIHQAHHSGEINNCTVSTCAEYFKALAKYGAMPKDPGLKSDKK